MAINITDADSYVKLHVIDVEDWFDSDDNRKQRLLNVASTVLNKRFSKYKIPDVAVYDFAAVLSIVYNDTNKLAQQGVKQFSIRGIAFTFNGGKAKELVDLIPQSTLDLISEENGGINLSTQRIGRSVR